MAIPAPPPVPVPAPGPWWKNRENLFLVAVAAIGIAAAGFAIWFLFYRDVECERLKKVYEDPKTGAQMKDDTLKDAKDRGCGWAKDVKTLDELTKIEATCPQLEARWNEAMDQHAYTDAARAATRGAYQKCDVDGWKARRAARHR